MADNNKSKAFGKANPVSFLWLAALTTQLKSNNIYVFIIILVKYDYAIFT